MYEPKGFEIMDVQSLDPKNGANWLKSGIQKLAVLMGCGPLILGNWNEVKGEICISSVYKYF